MLSRMIRTESASKLVTGVTRISSYGELMNDVQDMGGMHGFGPIELEENEPVFHSL